MNTDIVNPVTIGITAIAAVLISNHFFKKETFSSGVGYDMPESSNPLYLNMYKENMSKDFQLFDIIQNLKYKVFPSSPNKIVETNAGFGTVSMGENKAPIIVVPGLGTTNIIGRWNKPSSKNVKKLKDDSFETKEQWDCRQLQDNWTTLWYPKEDINIAKYCWEDNIRVNYNKETNSVDNSEGVITVVNNFGSLDFIPNSYMNTLIQALKAIGYKEGSTLYGAAYDFRKIACKDEMLSYFDSLKDLIERSVHLNQQKAILVGHSLGSNIINLFLVSQPKEWKDKYINFFATFSGAFGGCPKALRTILSGVDDSKDYKHIIADLSKNFTGVQWMLPSPFVYGDTPLVHLNNVSYTSKDIPKLLAMSNAPESVEIYKNIVFPVQTESLRAPEVPVFTFAGNNLKTESSYKYNNSVLDNPTKNYPYYQLNQAFADNFDYPEEFNGDGTIPKFALDVPLTWTKQQKEPINYRFYNRVEHKDILESEQPIKDFLSVVMQSN